MTDPTTPYQILLQERDTFWKNKQKALHRHIKYEPFDTFLEWSTINATMYVGETPYFHLERDYIKQHWPDLWYKAVAFEPYGHSPASRLIDPNFVHQAYHICRWEQSTKQTVLDCSSIVEFGSGYGALPFILRRIGYKGRYISYDLPELSYIQRQYHKHTNTQDIEYVTGGGWKSIWDKQGHDLFIGLWSLNEAANREQYIQDIKVRSVLIACLDEKEYVNLLTENIVEHWSIEIVHQHLAEHVYLFGTSK